MKKLMARLFLLIFALISFSTTVNALTAVDNLKNANEGVIKAIELTKSKDIEGAKNSYDIFDKAWFDLEDGVKDQSKQAYGDIEDKMGMVKFMFLQNPVQQDKLLQALEDLNKVNSKFIEGKYKNQEIKTKNAKVTIKDLVDLLEKSQEQIKNRDTAAALNTINTFSSSWLEVEGDVLTQSQKIYTDTEKDMVTAKAYLRSTPVESDKALKVIEKMHGYLSGLNGATSYSTIDVITIILREGLEALLVVIALLGFLKKSGQDDKKNWVYGGVLTGLFVSITLAITVKLIFTSGAFGNNNFLIAGWTGVFAAVMLLYVSYWLHSKSNVSEWNSYIKDKSTKALATGSLFSLGFLAFLAVFREGTETVLFYIGMASSISLTDLVLGIVIGAGILIIIALLVLTVGLKIPMRPFFTVSSLLVFYLGIKFTGMGINSLQLAGVLPPTTADWLPTISWLAIYPSLASTIPQITIVIIAIAMLILNNRKKQTM